MRKNAFLLSLIAILGLAGVSGCHTMEGAGEDVEEAGEEIEEGTDNF